MFIFAREQEKNEGSSMEVSGPSSERIAARDARYLHEAIGSRIGNSYSCKGRSTARSQAKLELHWQAVRAIRYHTTVTLWTVGDKEAREIQGLTKEDSEQVLVLRDCILRHSFWELDTIDDREWQNQMSCALKWQEHASRMRLIQSTREADIQNVEIPTWFVMESREGEDWLRPSHPLHDEKELGDQDEVTYAIAARLPVCALWNLFDC
jgi:hypothetical protein